jgi:hypothetical protein
LFCETNFFLGKKSDQRKLLFWLRKNRFTKQDYSVWLEIAPKKALESFKLFLNVKKSGGLATTFSQKNKIWGLLLNRINRSY